MKAPVAISCCILVSACGGQPGDGVSSQVYTCADWNGPSTVSATQFNTKEMQSDQKLSTTYYDSSGLCAVAFRVPLGTPSPVVKLVPLSAGALPIEAAATCEEYSSTSAIKANGLACTAQVSPCLHDAVGVTATLHSGGKDVASLAFSATTTEGVDEIPATCVGAFVPLCDEKILVDGHPAYQLNLENHPAAMSGWLVIRENGKLACIGADRCVLFRGPDATVKAALNIGKGWTWGLPGIEAFWMSLNGKVLPICMAKDSPSLGDATAVYSDLTDGDSGEASSVLDDVDTLDNAEVMP